MAATTRSQTGSYTAGTASSTSSVRGSMMEESLRQPTRPRSGRAADQRPQHRVDPPAKNCLTRTSNVTMAIPSADSYPPRPTFCAPPRSDRGKSSSQVTRVTDVPCRGGTVQLQWSGPPVTFLADHPVTGGYPDPCRSRADRHAPPGSCGTRCRPRTRWHRLGLAGCPRGLGAGSRGSDVVSRRGSDESPRRHRPPRPGYRPGRTGGRARRAAGQCRLRLRTLPRADLGQPGGRRQRLPARPPRDREPVEEWRP